MLEHHIAALQTAKKLYTDDEMSLVDFCNKFKVASLEKVADGDIVMTVKLGEYSVAELHTSRDIMNKVHTSTEYTTVMSIMLPSATFSELYQLANSSTVKVGKISTSRL